MGTSDPSCEKALAHLEEICSFVRILGSYHINGVLTGHGKEDFYPDILKETDSKHDILSLAKPRLKVVIGIDSWKFNVSKYFIVLL